MVRISTQAPGGVNESAGVCVCVRARSLVVAEGGEKRVHGNKLNTRWPIKQTHVSKSERKAGGASRGKDYCSRPAFCGCTGASLQHNNRCVLSGSDVYSIAPSPGDRWRRKQPRPPIINHLECQPELASTSGFKTR